MAVYVDHARIEWRGRLWCHLVADDLEELHHFAQRLSLPRSWFHRRASLPHYDVTTCARVQALRAGALPVTSREIVLRGRRSRLNLSMRIATAQSQHALF